MLNTGQRLHDYFFRDLWQVDLSTLNAWHRHGIMTLRLLFVLSRELLIGQLTLRAMSLVYTTLLSLVPLLAVSFSVLKAFGVHNEVEPLLYELLAPLGPRGAELTDRILGFVENIKVGVLGAVGFAFLFYTVITLIQKIEESFNYVWRIQNPRPFARRFSDYLSVILVGPVLVFAALGITATVMSAQVVQTLIAIEPFGTLMLVLSRLMPYLMISAAFTFIYIFIPNTRVHLRSALVGGVIAGVLWQTSGLIFAAFAAGSARYSAIYSSFAIVIFFMIWLYLSWLILLFGSQIAYYHQHPQQIRLSSGRLILSARLTEQVGLLIMYLITKRYVEGGQPWTTDALVQRLRMPGDALDDVMLALERNRLLARVSEEEGGGYLPARDPETVTLAELLHVLRSAEEHEYMVEKFELAEPAVSEVLDQARDAARSALGQRTLRDLVRGGEESEPVAL